jgi:outer membrane protein OmpA-like peptidoglycan-associated protein
MGDASDLNLSGGFVPTPFGKGPCIQVIYSPSGKQGWAGLFWQDPANNWGDIPGNAGYDLRGAERLTFWARGEKGGEKLREARVGGIMGQYPDSATAAIGPITLSKGWKQYTVDLRGKDLHHIIGGFGISLRKEDNPNGATLYLDDIVYEGPVDVFMSTTSLRTPAVAAADMTSTTEAVNLSTVSAITATYTMALGTSAATTVPSVAVSSPAAAENPPAPAEVNLNALKNISTKLSSSGLRVSFTRQLMFDPGKATLDPDSENILREVVKLLNAYPANKVLIEGHTDNTGDQGFNLKLSELRAGSVRDFLIREGGYDPARFRIVGYGDTRPIADNHSHEGRIMNRRVEITILKNTSDEQ